MLNKAKLYNYDAKKLFWVKQRFYKLFNFQTKMKHELDLTSFLLL